MKKLFSDQNILLTMCGVVLIAALACTFCGCGPETYSSGDAATADAGDHDGD